MSFSDRREAQITTIQLIMNNEKCEWYEKVLAIAPLQRKKKG